MNFKTLLVVCGTRKSEASGGLDAGEVSSFSIDPGQYSSNINSIADLIEHVDQNSALRGEWISSFRVNDIDIVDKIITETFAESHGNVDDVLHSLFEMGLFCNADVADLRQIVERVTCEKF